MNCECYETDIWQIAMTQYATRGDTILTALCENGCQIRRLVTLTDVAELAAAVFGIASGAFWIPSLHFFGAGP